MAEGARTRLGVDVAVSITGVAGPGGGGPEKPVGLVYIGLSGPAGTTVRRDVWPGSRAEIRAAAVRAALEMILDAAAKPRN
jgi:PncC family amidohydrolase